MQNETVGNGFALLAGNIILIGKTKDGVSCVITGDSVDLLREDWEGKRLFFPKNLDTIQFVSVNGHVVKKGRPVISGEEKAEDVIPNMEINTKIRYLYRDAENYKRWNEATVKGVIPKEEIDEIILCLHDGEKFIPEQVGLPAQRMQGYSYDPQSDTPYMELGKLWITPTGDPATVDISAYDLVRRFREAAGRWDESIDISW